MFLTLKLCGFLMFISTCTSKSTSIKENINTQVQATIQNVTADGNGSHYTENILRSRLTIIGLKPNQTITPNITVVRPKDCAEALKKGSPSGVYQIYPLFFNSTGFPVYCQADPDNGNAWTIIQRRQNGDVNFQRNWQTYRDGFGFLNGEYFLGLEKLHALTTEKPHELWIQLEDFEGFVRYAKYSNFEVGNESTKYTLKLGKYSGNAGDSLSYQNNQKFATFDKDSEHDCVQTRKGGFWFKYCAHAMLNGLYLHGPTTLREGIYWDGFRGRDYSLRYVHMAIRS